MDQEITFYPPQDLKWTKPKEDFQAEDSLEYGREQCEILHEARSRLLDALIKKEPNRVREHVSAQILMQPAYSKADEKIYAPQFSWTVENQRRFFIIAFNRLGPTEVDLDNILGIKEVTEEMEEQFN